MTGDYSERGLTDLVSRGHEGARWARDEIEKLRAALLGLDSAASQGFMRAKPSGPTPKAAPKQFG